MRCCRRAKSNYLSSDTCYNTPSNIKKEKVLTCTNDPYTRLWTMTHASGDSTLVLGEMFYETTPHPMHLRTKNWEIEEHVMFQQMLVFKLTSDAAILSTKMDDKKCLQDTHMFENNCHLPLNSAMQPSFST